MRLCISESNIVKNVNRMLHWESKYRELHDENGNLPTPDRYINIWSTLRYFLMRYQQLRIS